MMERKPTVEAASRRFSCDVAFLAIMRRLAASLAMLRRDATFTQSCGGTPHLLNNAAGRRIY
jgi:hypothetical protein